MTGHVSKLNLLETVGPVTDPSITLSNMLAAAGSHLAGLESKLDGLDRTVECLELDCSNLSDPVKVLSPDVAFDELINGV